MSVKSYKCPFCTHRGTKEELGSHVEEEHEECIPKGMTANQIVFNSIYHKDHGTCVVCKRPTKWNEVACKYNRLCGRASCQKTLREAYKKNMLKVHGTTTLLNDPEQQEKMLANRKISGKYKFTDGGFHIYTGSYEEKALEFLDKVMGFKSTDILSPGPIIEYTYKGKKLVWITDIMLIPFNLIIEVKDGGSNPNNREMPVYREKQLAKEEMITNMGKYNYLRLTNNDFSQLLGIVAELKAQMIDDSEDNKKVIINVNEEVRMLKESVLQESSVGYDDAKKIYDSLTDEEKGFVSPNGRFVDSPILVYRYIYKVGKKAVGFIDCYKNNGKSITTAFIVYAVSAKYRGKGISKVLLDKAVAGCRSKGYKKLIYRCNSKNTASIKAAESYGFKLIKSSKNEKLYKIDLDDSINEGTNSSTSPIYYNYRDNNLILESTKSVKGPKELVDLYNRLEENFSYEERDDNFKAYRTKSPEEFEKLGYGVCLDYADYEAKELEKVGYRCTTKDLTNNAYSLYYHQFNSDDGMNPTHTWVACMKDNKVYVVESSWYSFKGVHCFDNEEDMIAVYVNKLNEDRLPNLLMKYKPSTKFGLDAVKYMNHIYNTGVIVIDNVGMQESVNSIIESAFDKYKKNYKTFDEFCKAMNNITDVLNWTKINKCKWPDDFNAQDRSKGIHIYWPEDILKDKIGTCFDFALLMHYFCEKKHIENHILRLARYFRRYGETKYQMFQHFMCIFKEKDMYYGFNYQGRRSYGLEGPFESLDMVKKIIYKSQRKNIHSINTILGKASDKDIWDVKVFVAIEDTKEYSVYDKFYGDKKIFRDDMMFKYNYLPSLVSKYDNDDPKMHNDTFANVKEKLEHMPSSIKAKAIYYMADLFNMRESVGVDPMLESVRRGKPNLIPVRSDNKSSLLGLDTHALNTVISTIIPGVYITAIARSLAPLLILAGAAALAGAAQWFHMDFLKVDKYGDSKKNGKYIIDGDSVYATNDGEVSFICRSSDKVNVLGNAVVIKHDGFYSLYAHMQDNSITVKKGDIVSRGDIIGKVGNTGNSTESHLHFGFAYTDPSALRYLAGLGSICKEIDNLEQYDYIPISDSNIMDASLELDSGTIKLGDFTDKKYIKNKTGLMHPFCFIKTNNRVVETAMIENFIRPIDTNKEE